MGMSRELDSDNIAIFYNVKVLMNQGNASGLIHRYGLTLQAKGLHLNSTEEIVLVND